MPGGPLGFMRLIRVGILHKVPGNGAKKLVNQFFDRPNLFISFVLSLKYPTTELPGNCHCFVTEFSAAGFSIFK